MISNVYSKVDQLTYKSLDGKVLKYFTGRIQAFYFHNDWVLIDDKNTLIDWDWNLNSLIKRNNLILNM